MISFSGNLYFSHLLKEDSQNGLTYACVAFNELLNKTKIGEYQRINPLGGKIIKQTKTFLMIHK